MTFGTAQKIKNFKRRTLPWTIKDYRECPDTGFKEAMDVVHEILTRNNKAQPRLGERNLIWLTITQQPEPMDY